MATVHEPSLNQPAAVIPARHPRSRLPAVFSIAICVVVELLVLVTRTPLMNVLEEFEIEAPLLTYWVLGWELPTILAVIMLAAILVEVIPRLRSAANIFHGGLVLLACGCLAIYLIGVSSPLLTMMEGLS